MFGDFVKSPPGKETPAAASAEKGAPKAPPEPSVESLQARLRAIEDERDRLRAELGDARDRFLRARADYDNLARRTGKESADSVKAAKGGLILRIVHLVEALEVANADMEKANAAAASGLKMVLDEAHRLLRDEGIKEIEALGQMFNHRFHHAVETVERAGAKAESIVEVVQRGYTLHGEVLRPALVKVAKGQKVEAAPQEPKA